MSLYTKQNNCTQLPNYRKLNLASVEGHNNLFPDRIGEKLKSILYRTERQDKILLMFTHSYLHSLLIQYNGK